MSEDRIGEQGEQLHRELQHERTLAGGPHRWRCSGDLRARVLAYAVACTVEGDSHRRIAERLGVVQATLSRWIREGTAGDTSFRSVAIVPSGRRPSDRAGQVAPASLRLLSPRGFVVEGLDAELLASLLQVLG